MLLAIAILSLVGFIGGVIMDVLKGDEHPNPHTFISAVCVLSWWTISFPFAIVLLVLSAVWLIIVLGSYWSTL